MITPEDFPYIKSLYVNNCYTYRDFNIQLHDYKPFSHLILTGKNGSGKSTILKSINEEISSIRFQSNSKSNRTAPEIGVIYGKNTHLSSFYRGRPTIYSFIKAGRQVKSVKVSTVVSDKTFKNSLTNKKSSEDFVKQFKQYLVNKKVNQAFDQINNNRARLYETDIFFERLTNSLRQVFEDKDLKLIFRQEDFDFFIQVSGGRQFAFDVISEGFSAILSILVDLFMQIDIIQNHISDYSYNPCGIVLIDEPETHLHLQLQEQVLPLLTSLFPNIQFIAATHSPAVIASIKNATIFDLTTKETRISEEAVGRSYSDLMMSHFELNNEYSNIADGIIAQVDKAVAEFGNNPARLREVLQPIYDANSAYLSPTLKVKFELLMAEQEAKAVAHS